MTPPLPTSVTLHLSAEDATVHLGQQIGQHLAPSTVVWLRGELGAGKTTLTRGILRSLGHDGAVKSPTYTIVEPYEALAGGALYHFDLYRLGDPDELEYLGVRDYLTAGALLLVEWPDRGGALFPAPDLEVALTVLDDGRDACITAHSERAVSVLAHLRL